jgi:hypothetical protein
MTEIALTVPLPTPSGNQLSGYHWRRRHRMKRDWQWGVLAAMGGVRADWPLKRVEVTIERHTANPIKDLDNAVAGLKPVLDGMVAAGAIADDSEAVVTKLTVVQIAAPRKATRTVIRLRAAP